MSATAYTIALHANDDGSSILLPVLNEGQQWKLVSKAEPSPRKFLDAWVLLLMDADENIIGSEKVGMNASFAGIEASKVLIAAVSILSGANTSKNPVSVTGKGNFSPVA